MVMSPFVELKKEVVELNFVDNIFNPFLDQAVERMIPGSFE